jgi:hypothetical protein
LRVAGHAAERGPLGGIDMTDRSDQASADATYLQSVGMSEAELSALHHFSLKNRGTFRYHGTFNGVRRYFTPGKQLRRNNSRFAERLACVAREHRSGTSKSFATLVHEALARLPLTQETIG